MKAIDIMSSPVIGVRPDAPVREVAGLLLERSISAVPVLEGERLVGLVSEADVLRRRHLSVRARRARDIMTREVETVTPDTPVEEMVASTNRGILVTRLWYIREVDPYQKIMTGMTRDGTFLVEGGKITRGLRNFRFNQDLIELLSNVEALSPSVRASVNGTVKTVGRRPAASCAAKVAPFHAYSTGLTVMFGCCFSNNATLSLNCFWAASELPGRNAATLIVTFEAAVAIDAAPTATNSPVATTTSVIALRVAFIVLPFRGLLASARRCSGGRRSRACLSSSHASRRGAWQIYQNNARVQRDFADF